jgi:hypothetical protein
MTSSPAAKRPGTRGILDDIMKVSDLNRAQLDYWVAKAAGIVCRINTTTKLCEIYVSGPPGEDEWILFMPSIDWSDGGPIIERERIGVIPAGEIWSAYKIESTGSGISMKRWRHFSDTPLEAAMRCYVTARFGDTVPDATEAEE